MLESDPGPGHLPRPRLPTDLGRQLQALGQPGGTKRMALTDEAPAGVHHVLAAVGVVSTVHKVPGLADRAETQRLVGYQFVGRETVVQLNNLI